MVGTLGPGIGLGKAARFYYVSTAGQTTYSGADASPQALTLSYTPGYVEVSVDGIWLTPDEYTATNGSSIVFPTGLAAGRKVYVYCLSTFSVPLNIPIGMGQCQLVLSGGNLLLKPRGGQLLTINGTNCQIPSAGVSLAPTGLTAGTLYYIYALSTAGVVTSLEASATGHSTSATAGNVGTEIKTGDDTRSLVGMARAVTGPAFADTLAQRFVASWFNRRSIGGSASFSAERSVTSTTFVEVNSEIRNEFLTWADECIVAVFSGGVYNSTNTGGGATTYTDITYDGVVQELPVYFDPTAINVYSPVSAHNIKSGLSEGYHYATIAGKAAAGTGKYIGVLRTEVRG